MTGYDHQALVAKGIQILRAMNETSTNETKPFVVFGDPKLKEVRSCWGSSKQFRGIVGVNK